MDIPNLQYALVGEHSDLYQRSAQFRYQVDMLSGMLPAMVDGLASSAVTTSARIAVAIEAAKNVPAPQIFVSREDWEAGALRARGKDSGR